MEGDKRIEEIGEFELIARLDTIFGSTEPAVDGFLGIGDDCAVLPAPKGGRWLVSVDAQVEGIHYEPRWMPPVEAGRRALSVAVSDLAAMGGSPAYAFLSLALSGSLALSWLIDFATGFAESAEAMATRVAGGNISRGPAFAASVTVLGTPSGPRAVTRSGGAPGDVLYVSGALGGAALGLRVVRGEAATLPEKVREELRRRLVAPEPRLREGACAAEYASAMIDISDGLAGDLGHLCRSSRCGAELDSQAIPTVDGADLLARQVYGDPFRAGLWGGEDYELLCAIPPVAVSNFESEAARRGLEFARVGRLVPGAGVEVILPSGGRERCVAGGFDHFARPRRV